jgi:hypothetical protein
VTEKNGPGQAAKKQAEARTEQVADEKAADARANAVDGNEGSPDRTPERADDAPARVEGRDARQDPFPDYDSSTLDELKSLAESRNVEINRDVEKAELVKELRAGDSEPEAQARAASDGDVENPYASYDVMPLEELRSLADSRDVGLSDEFVRAQLVTELRAADTSGGVGVAFNKAPVNPS